MKNRNNMNPVLIRNEEDENQQVRKDFFTVVILNAIFLALMIGLYIWNRNTGSVDQFFSRFLNF